MLETRAEETCSSYIVGSKRDYSSIAIETGDGQRRNCRQGTTYKGVAEEKLTRLDIDRER